MRNFTPILVQINAMINLGPSCIQTGKKESGQCKTARQQTQTFKRLGKLICIICEN